MSPYAALTRLYTYSPYLADVLEKDDHAAIERALRDMAEDFAISRLLVVDEKDKCDLEMIVRDKAKAYVDGVKAGYMARTSFQALSEEESGEEFEQGVFSSGRLIVDEKDKRDLERAGKKAYREAIKAEYRASRSSFGLSEEESGEESETVYEEDTLEDTANTTWDYTEEYTLKDTEDATWEYTEEVSPWRPLPQTPPNCTICDREYRRRDWPNPEANACEHESNACLPCWQQWLDVQVSTKRPEQINCISCPKILSQVSIRHLATPATFERFLDAEMKILLSADPDFMWCPASRCRSGQVHGEGHIFVCAECGHQSCTDCNVPWHEGLTCRQYQNGERAGPEIRYGDARSKKQQKQRKEDEASSIVGIKRLLKKRKEFDARSKKIEKERKQADARRERERKEAEARRFKVEKERVEAIARRKREEEQSEQKLSNMSKLCPGRRCGRKVEKVSGCDHMTCTMCRHEFCWLCLADYGQIRDYGNTYHKAGCKYYQ